MNKLFVFLTASLIFYGNVHSMSQAPSTTAQNPESQTLLELERLFAALKEHAPMPSEDAVDLFKKKNVFFPDDKEKIVACIKKQHAIVAFKNTCKERNIDLQVRDQEANTLLHLFHMAQMQNASYHDADFAEALLEAGVKIVDENGNGLQNNEKRTAFFLATQPFNIPLYRENKGLIKLYLQHGADPYEINFPLHLHVFSDAFSPHSPFENMLMLNDLESIALCITYKTPPSHARHFVLAARHSRTPVLKAVLASAPYSAHTYAQAIAIIEGNVQVTQALITASIPVLDITPAVMNQNLSQLRENLVLLQSTLNDLQKRQKTVMPKMQRELNEMIIPHLQDQQPPQPEINTYFALRAQEIGIPHHIRRAQAKKAAYIKKADKTSRKRKLDEHEKAENKDDE